MLLAVQTENYTLDGSPKPVYVIPESCTKYRSEAQKALCLKRSWGDFDPQAYYLYGEDQNHETSFKGKALQAVVDTWCKIQVIALYRYCLSPDYLTVAGL
jgi:hypothetical protein